MVAAETKLLGHPENKLHTCLVLSSKWEVEPPRDHCHIQSHHPVTTSDMQGLCISWRSAWRICGLACQVNAWRVSRILPETSRNGPCTLPPSYHLNDKRLQNFTSLPPQCPRIHSYPSQTRFWLFCDTFLAILRRTHESETELQTQGTTTIFLFPSGNGGLWEGKQRQKEKKGCFYNSHPLLCQPYLGNSLLKRNPRGFHIRLLHVVTTWPNLASQHTPVCSQVSWHAAAVDNNTSEKKAW